MQGLQKVEAINKGVGSIKIRKVRVFSRKGKKSQEISKRNASIEDLESKGQGKKSERYAGSFSTSKIEKNFYIPIQFSDDPFNGIQEINENSEDDEDSVIVQLNEMLEKKKEKFEKFRVQPKKDSLVSLKIKIKEKESGKTERVLPKVKSWIKQGSTFNT